MLNATIAIPTYNRPKDLQNCIGSILAQTVKPFELIVVDDGNLSELPLKDECEKAQIAYRYFRKDIPGLTESRNLAVAKAKGDIVAFLDDDVILLPNYLEEILKAYEDESEGVVYGVGGMIIKDASLKVSRRLKLLYDRFFLISGKKEGKVLPSGFCTEIGETAHPLDRISQVDFLSGGVSSFRKEVFEEFLFTSRYRRLGLGEDKDFSYQVSRKYKLVVNPNARLHHLESSLMRPDKRSRGKMFILGRFLFFRYRLEKSWWNWPCFCYAMLGYIMQRGAISLAKLNKGEMQRIRGIFEGFKDIAAGKITYNESANSL